MRRIGFHVNPIAGMSGRVGLKGTDGVVKEARVPLWAQPVVPQRAAEERTCPIAVACNADAMAGLCRDYGWRDTSVGWILRRRHRNRLHDIRRTCSGWHQRCDTAFPDAWCWAHYPFVVATGTVRYICCVAGLKVPILGIPSGVYKYSGVAAGVQYGCIVPRLSII